MKIKGEKLKIARILAGYTATELAEKIGITKQSLSQYESGIEPRLDVYMKLLQILNCKNEFLRIPFSNDLYIKNTFFRANAAAKANERNNQQIKTEIVSRLYSFLLEYLDLPKLNLPLLDETLSIEEKAMALREFWGLKNRPIKNMVGLLESNGIIVSSFNSSSGILQYKIDAYTQQYIDKSISENDLFCVIVENNIDSCARKNFSLAHELGHIVLHNNDDYSSLSKTEQNQLENEANLFASAFLLPREQFKIDAEGAHNLNNFVDLKKKWFVSMGAMMIRAKQLGIITNETYLKLIKNYSYHNFKSGEPLDNEIPIVKPSVFKVGLELLFENGLTLDDFQNQLVNKGLSLSLNTIEDLLCLGTGFFDKYRQEDDGVVIQFKKS